MPPRKSSRAEVIVCKQLLWRQLNCNSDLTHLVNEEIQIKSRLNDAFERRVSTSILVVGPTGSGKRELVEKVMIDYCTEGVNRFSPVSVARINGLVHLNDNQAVISLADQLLLRPSSYDRNVNIANEDLENHFRQCRFDSQPAVIIVEELQEFSKREKQVLIYTLLDLMHREDLLFVMIGTTKSADVNYLLEKRVLSRFSAQFVYVQPSLTPDICLALAKRLTLPQSFTNRNGQSGENILTSGSDPSEVERNEKYSNYRNRFNAQTLSCFGSIPVEESVSSSSSESLEHRCKGAKKKEGEGGEKETEQSDDASVSEDDDDEKPIEKPKSTAPSVRGTLYDDIQCCVEDGSSLKHFFKAAQMAVAMLSPEHDVLTAPMYRECLRQLERPGLAVCLSGLPELELNLAAAIARVRMRVSGYKSSSTSAVASFTSSSSSSSSSSGGVGSSRQNSSNKAPRIITVDDAMSEFNKLSSVVSRKILPEEYVKSAFLSLAKNGIIVLNNGYDEAIPKDLVTGHSIIDFLPALHEFEAAFKKGYFADSWIGSSSEAGNENLTSSSSSSTVANSTAQNSEKDNNNGKRTFSDGGASLSSSSSGMSEKYNQQHDYDRSAPTLRVSNRVRRAVLNPHEPVLMEGSIAIL